MNSIQRWVILATVLALVGVTGTVVATSRANDEPQQVDRVQHGDGMKTGAGTKQGDGEKSGDGKKKRRKDQCIATDGDHKVTLSREEAANAATIAAVGTERGLPRRAISIALATAYQESYLRNLDYGDRDSLGLFQQRPSMGWGTPKQVRDPEYSAGKFYDALVTIPRYGEMKITDAAQAVQRSAYPKAYAKHGRNARVLAKALTGRSEGKLHCTFEAKKLKQQKIGNHGFTPRTAKVIKELTGVFGGSGKKKVSSGRVNKSPFYDGHAFDIYFEPHKKKASDRDGWQVAHWLAVNAKRLGVSTITYDDKIWSQRSSHMGWRPYTPPTGDPKSPTLRHLDHIHVAVARGS